MGPHSGLSLRGGKSPAPAWNMELPSIGFINVTSYYIVLYRIPLQ